MKALFLAALVIACAHAATVTMTSVPSELLGNWVFVSSTCDQMQCSASLSFTQSSNSSLEMSTTTFNTPQCLNGTTITFAVDDTVANGAMASGSVSNFTLTIDNSDMEVDNEEEQISLSNTGDKWTLTIYTPETSCQNVFTKTDAVTMTDIVTVTEAVTSVPIDLLGNWICASSTCPNNCAASVSFAQSSSTSLEMSTTTLNTPQCLNGTTITFAINDAAAYGAMASGSVSNFTLTIDNSDLDVNTEAQFSLSLVDGYTLSIYDASNSCETSFIIN